MLYFAYGEIFSLFPASLTDTYGRRETTAHYGLLYTAKGVASLLIPITSEIHDMKGSWKPVMIMCFTLGFTASILILFLARPLKRNLIQKINERHGALELDNQQEGAPQ